MIIKLLKGQFPEKLYFTTCHNQQINQYARTSRKNENSDVILESKMAGLNQNKYSKQANRPDADLKFILPLK